MALSDASKSWRITERPGRNLDARLFPVLEKLLKRAGRTLRDIEGVAVCSGPGRFTSIRVGMTFAGVLAKCLGVPAAAVSRIEASGCRILSRKEYPDGKYAVSLPGFRGESFLQEFRKRRGAVAPAGEPRWRTVADSGPVPSVIDAGLLVPSALDLIPLAEAVLRKGGGKVHPLYLKPANFLRAHNEISGAIRRPDVEPISRREERA